MIASLEHGRMSEYGSDVCECQWGSRGDYGSDGVGVGMAVTCDCGINEGDFMTVGVE